MSESITSSDARGSADTKPTRLMELAMVFGRLGILGFGGPAAHIAMMDDEFVKRRNWITHENFLDMLGVTNLIPGPNSTEMAIHIGLVRAGWRGLIVAGICFIAPAILLTTGFAYLYVTFGTLPRLAPLIAGIRPAIIAIILGAVIRLGKPVVKKNISSGIIGVIIAALSLAGINEIFLLFAGGVLALAWNNRNLLTRRSVPILLALLLAPLLLGVTQSVENADPPSLTGLGLFFLKIGSILYGSGYVLVAFLQNGLVETRHWLTQTQLLDAIAVGQFTPGPVLSTAAFIGFVLLGFPGATVASVGIFLPSFVFVPIVSPLVGKFRSNPSVKGLLNGVNASALGLMLAVCATLGISTLISPLMWLLFIAAGSAMLIWDFHPAWLVVASASVSWLATFIQI